MFMDLTMMILARWWMKIRIVLFIAVDESAEVVEFI